MIAQKTHPHAALNDFTPAQQSALDSLFESRLAVRIYDQMKAAGVDVTGEMVLEEVAKFMAKKRKDQRR